MKDKVKENIINKFVGLKSKRYSLVPGDNKEIEKRKASMNILLTASDIKNMLTCCLVEVMRHRIKQIQSNLHRIGTYNVCKISLSCFDDKRHILDDGISSLAYFHKDILNQ